VILALAVKDVVRVAVNEAKPPAEALTGVVVTVHGGPHEEPVIGTPEFWNCTAPVGAMPKLVVLTVAVRVTVWLDVTVVALAARPMVVGA
jgi:hypothetical protein